MRSLIMCTALTISSYLMVGFSLPTIVMLVALVVGTGLGVIAMWLDRP